MNSILFRILNRLVHEYEIQKSIEIKKKLKYCGKNVYISPKATIWSESGMELGDNVCINTYTHIFASGGIKIGENTMISSNCSISTVTHQIHTLDRKPIVEQSVIIGKNVWIGAGAIILPGVTIGDNSVVGAGAVVTRDIPCQQVFVGNPAKFLKEVNL